jgi:coproporphyrinogen III oxidase-like Fe-S oxidoreductase
MDIRQLDRLLMQMGEREDDCEVTLEMNPYAGSLELYRAWKRIGVNRVSIGVQTLDDKALSLLGREHGSRDALFALEWAAQVFGTKAVSCDLIQSMPVGWHSDAWDLSREIRHVMEFADHLSIYELTLEPSTPLKRLHDQKALRMPSVDESADTYDQILSIIEAHNWTRYEVSSYARNTCSESRHNWAYWNGSPFLGLGPGAHGRLRDKDGVLWETIEVPGSNDWHNAILQGHSSFSKCRALTFEEECEELLLSTLRTRLGLSADQRSKCAPVIDELGEKALLDTGLLERIPGDRLVASRRGLPVLDTILGRLIKKKKKTPNTLPQ